MWGFDRSKLLYMVLVSCSSVLFSKFIHNSLAERIEASVMPRYLWSVNVALLLRPFPLLWPTMKVADKFGLDRFYDG